MSVTKTVESATYTATEGITAAVAERAVRCSIETLPPEALQLAKQCVLDWLGVTIAGASEPLVDILVAEAREQGGAPQATVIGRGLRAPTQQAAWINGAASHALDYDDVNLAIEGHPTAPILPAALALAEHRGASGAELLSAFAAGYETACRIGLLMAPGHYERGFHATSTVGSFGAAAACAHLLGLDADRTATSFGIAGTQAAGLKSMFGTMCKPLHAGVAAQNGLLAASLAAKGFDSRKDVLECEQGFAATHSPDFDPQAALADPPGGCHMRANLYKYHASCYLTHASIECCRRLRVEHAIDPANIDEVRILAGNGCDNVCNIQDPKTGLEAKFSLRMTAAFALSGVDTAALDSFSAENCADPGLSGLKDKVRVEIEPAWPRTKCNVQLTLRDGATHETTHDSGVPAEDLAGQGVRLEKKFRSLVNPVLGADKADALIESVNRLESLATLDEILGPCATA